MIKLKQDNIGWNHDLAFLSRQTMYLLFPIPSFGTHTENVRFCIEWLQLGYDLFEDLLTELLTLGAASERSKSVISISISVRCARKNDSLVETVVAVELARRGRSFNYSSLDDGTSTKLTGTTNGTLDASEYLSKSAGNVTVKSLHIAVRD
jgi:hypothetical protein